MDLINQEQRPSPIPQFTRLSVKNVNSAVCTTFISVNFSKCFSGDDVIYPDDFFTLHRDASLYLNACTWPWDSCSRKTVILQDQLIFVATTQSPLALITRPCARNGIAREASCLALLWGPLLAPL